MNQSSCFQNNLVDLSNAPWTMHEFFAGSGLVAYGLKGMFKPIWANDISEQKAVVYKENFGDGYFKLDDNPPSPVGLYKVINKTILGSSVSATPQKEVTYLPVLTPSSEVPVFPPT